MTRSANVVRPWRGQSPEERVAERKARLLDAALDVFTECGYQATTVRDICRAAGLTERYFYESFPNREALLIALGDVIVADIVTAAAPSLDVVATDLDAGIVGAIEAVVRSLTDDPRRARIVFVESVGVSPEVERQRRAAIARIATVIAEAAALRFGEWARESVEVEMIARTVIGGASELVVAYIRGELPINQRELVTNTTLILLRARTVLVAMAAERDIPPDLLPVSETQED